jgi:FkbM family methyltransferase
MLPAMAEVANMFISYAQNFEDVILWRALGSIQDGHYIDVGAQHPVVDSVSRAFYEHGWRGVHVEPTQQYATLIGQDRPDELLVNAALGREDGLLSFYEFPDTGLSTLDADIAERHKSEGFAAVERLVPVITLDALFGQLAFDQVHWMKIDVEGAECDVLEGWRDSQVRPWVVVVESTLPLSQEKSHDQWELLVLAKGYRFCYFDGLNRYYVSDAHPELADRIDCPPNVFDGFSFSRRANQVFVEDLRQALGETAGALDALTLAIEDLCARTGGAVIAGDGNEKSSSVRALRQIEMLAVWCGAMREQRDGLAHDVDRLSGRLEEAERMLQLAEGRVVASHEAGLVAAREAERMVAGLQARLVQAHEELAQSRLQAERAESLERMLEGQSGAARDAHERAELLQQALAANEQIRLQQAERIAEQESALQDSRLDLFRAGDQIQSLEAYCNHLQRERDALHASTSWRITAPVRWIKRSALGLIGRKPGVAMPVPGLGHSLQADAGVVEVHRDVAAEASDDEFEDLWLGGLKVRFARGPLRDNRGIGRVSREQLDALRRLEASSTPGKEDGRTVYFYSSIHWCPEVLPHPSVVMVHDVIPLLFQQEFPGEIVQEWSGRYARIARQADRIVTISHSSAEDITRLLGIDGHVDVVYNGVTRLPVAQVPGELGVPAEPYFAYLGSFDQHKNLQVVLRALADPRCSHLTLVLIGDNGACLPLAEELGVVHRLVFAGRLPDDQAGLLVAGALAMVFPSLYEGFGLPPLEAALLGTPSICSRRPAMTETLEGCALFADPHDAEQWVEAMLEIAGATELREQLAARARERVEGFAWRDAAAGLLTILERTAKGGAR